MKEMDLRKRDVKNAYEFFASIRNEFIEKAKKAKEPKVKAMYLNQARGIELAEAYEHGVLQALEMMV